MLSSVDPMLTLFEQPGSAAPLPAPLAAAYGGGLALAEDVLYANFVASVDGVTALERRRGSGAAISRGNDADRFLMGLLRSLSDAIVVGAGTLREDGGQSWSVERLAPQHAADYRMLRRSDPRLVVVTRSGDLDVRSPALQAGATVLTSAAGASRLRRRLPASCEVEVLEGDRLAGTAVRAALRSLGHRRLLTEGGPHLLATFLRDEVLDELFLTLSPVLAGRDGHGRLGLVEGLTLPSESFAGARLQSVKRHGSFLFLRYALSRSGAE